MVHDYTVFEHGLMMSDRVRMDAHTRALRLAVKPGSVVVDIGTGAGIFALLACQFGARRVYAIDPHDVIQVACELAAANGFAGQIHFIQDVSTRVMLPERADVIIADVRGALPESQIPTLIDARKRLLAPGGTLIPQRDTLWATVLEAPALYGQHIDPWDESGPGLDMKAAHRRVTNQVHTRRKGQMTPEQFLAEPRPWAEIDYTRVESTEIAADVNWTVLRSGTGHGVITWFDTTLAEGVGFSNTPLAPELAYSSAFFPWSEPVPLDQGDMVAVTLHSRMVGAENLWCWDTRVMVPGDSTWIKASFKQSEFFGTPISPKRRRNLDAGHVPRLDEDGEIDRFLLELIDGKNSLGDMARRAATRFPARFPRWEDALTHASVLAKAYSPSPTSNGPTIEL
jgi:protein arginine N-methyltransferase 1